MSNQSSQEDRWQRTLRNSITLITAGLLFMATKANLSIYGFNILKPLGLIFLASSLILLLASLGIIFSKLNGFLSFIEKVVASQWLVILMLDILAIIAAWVAGKNDLQQNDWFFQPYLWSGPIWLYAFVIVLISFGLYTIYNFVKNLGWQRSISKIVGLLFIGITFWFFAKGVSNNNFIQVSITFVVLLIVMWLTTRNRKKETPMAKSSQLYSMLNNTINFFSGSKTQRIYERQFFPQYWNSRSRWQRIKFIIGKSIFGVRNWNSSQRQSLFILFEILKTIIWQVILAVIIVGFLVGINYLLIKYTAISQFFPKIDAGLISNYLSVVAQVAGVFLGLYFTAVSVVASAVYARVPGEIRELLTKEKVGNQYIQLVALTVAVATLLLIKGALGFSVDILDIVLIALLTIMTIFSFVRLGMRIFYFFDFTELV